MTETICEKIGRGEKNRAGGGAAGEKVGSKWRMQTTREKKTAEPVKKTPEMNGLLPIKAIQKKGP